MERSETLYPGTTHVLAPFEALAASAPEAEALSFRAESLSYGELDARASRLARALAGRGVASGVRVALCMERSVELVVSILATIKAGGTYVPIDPTYPPELLAAMLEDTRCAVVLTHVPTADRVPLGNWEIVATDALLPLVPDEGAGDGHLPPSLDGDLAIFFSSGSTGRPKGSLLRAEGFWNAFQWFGRVGRLEPGSRLLLMTPHAFDASFKSIMAPLLFGGTLVLAEPGPFDPKAVLETIEREKIDASFITPSGLYALLEQAAADDYRPLSGLRMLFFGGEATDPRRLRDWVASPHFKCELVHIYGPSECSDVTTYHPVDKKTLEAGAAIPIGAPVDNVRHYVLDPFHNLQPVGIAGELCLGGFMLARGYVGDPAATAEKFVPDPFATASRLYRTGDRVRRDGTGAITFLGRLDRQVKLRGIRVEPDGVARILEGHPAVREAVAMVRAREDGEAQLVAYVAFHPGPEPRPEELRSYLRGRLPPYMVPAAIVTLATFPLSPNGKFDWQAFPDPAGQPVAEDWTGPAPQTPLEQTLAGIWCEVLGLAAVGIHADLFDLGGHSLLATQIVSRVNSAFDVDIPIRTLFEAPTVAGFADAIRQLEPEKRLDEYAELLLHVASLSAQDVAGELRRLAQPGGD